MQVMVSLIQPLDRKNLKLKYDGIINILRQINVVAGVSLYLSMPLRESRDANRVT